MGFKPRGRWRSVVGVTTLLAGLARADSENCSIPSLELCPPLNVRITPSDTGFMATWQTRTAHRTLAPDQLGCPNGTWMECEGAETHAMARTDEGLLLLSNHSVTVDGLHLLQLPRGVSAAQLGDPLRGWSDMTAVNSSAARGACAPRHVHLALGSATSSADVTRLKQTRAMQENRETVGMRDATGCWEGLRAAGCMASVVCVSHGARMVHAVFCKLCAG